MKIFQLCILVLILVSCKKENVYYYSNNKEIKDSTVIRFVNTELKKLDIASNTTGLKIYTTLDSVSYKTNLDSIRLNIFENFLKNSFKPEDKQAFNEWFREKIIVVDNQTGKVVNFYSTFKKEKFDRNDITMIGIQNIIVLGSFLSENPEAEITEHYLSYYPQIVYPSDSFKIKKREADFLSGFKIDTGKSGNYLSNYISFLDVLKIFQTYNRSGILKDPATIKKVLNNHEIIYSMKENSRKIFSPNVADKIQQCLKVYKEDRYKVFKNELKNTQNIFSFGTNSDFYTIVNDGKYTYLIYNFTAIPTNLNKKQFINIPNRELKKIGVRYYDAIRK